jgi:NDP-sugar pyrophosphorylase family protein
VYNGDILSDLPLQPALEAHSQSGNEVTLVLRSKDGPLHINFDESTGKIRDIGRKLLPHEAPSFLFTGIYLVNPSFLDRIPTKTKISVVPKFLEMIRDENGVGGVVIDEGTWWDLGSREQILAVHAELAKVPQKPAPWISPDSQIHPNAKILGACAVGPNARIGAGVILEDSIVWEDTVIDGPSRLTRCIVTSGRTVEGDHTDADL